MINRQLLTRKSTIWAINIAKPFPRWKETLKKPMAHLSGAYASSEPDNLKRLPQKQGKSEEVSVCTFLP